MKRGYIVALIVLGEAVVAAVYALIFGFVMEAATSYAQRSGNWHGGGPPTTPEEHAAVRAAGSVAFVSSFAVVLAAELAFSVVVFLIVRRAASLAAIPAVERAPKKPRPLGVWFLAASFSYAICAGLALTLVTYVLGSVSPLNAVFFCVQLVAGGVGLWLSLTREPAPRNAVIGCAVALCVIAYFNIPPFGPALLIWPIALLLLLANDSVQAHFDGRPLTET